MASLNKVMLIGRLGKDPEVRYTQSGNAVSNFSIATNDYWTDKQGQKQESTEWHNLVLWGKLADLAQNYLKKGSQIYVEGRLQTRDWEDKQGQRHYMTEVVVARIQFLDSKNTEGGGYSDTANPAYPQNPDAASPPPNPANAQEPPASNPVNPVSVQEPPEGDYIKDDIPF